MILVFAELSNGIFKKATCEALSYAHALSQKTQETVCAVVLGSSSDCATLGQYGAQKVFHVDNPIFNNFDSRAYAKAILQVVKEQGAKTIIFSNNNTAKAIAPRVAAALKAGLVAGAVAVPEVSNGFVVKKSVFSGKAFSFVKINSDYKVISIIPNSVGVNNIGGQAEVIASQVAVGQSDFSVKVESVNKVSGTVPLTEAELVVSGGRGLKGPENWGILEELASNLGATLACSRPVADSHWRPHHEHVGQTGGTIRPNLYIAVGISGAIQHLAGVNSSKTIVVINKDPEAPFFKAADYGVLGDAFEIVPKLTEAVKKFKASQNA